MRLQASPKERFLAWFVRAIAKLKELPEGDGAFAAFMIAIPLYERLIIARLKLAGQRAEEEDVKREIGNDLKLNDHDRSIFWDMIRNGFMHQGMAKSGKTTWLVSHRFGPLPEFHMLRGKRCLCVDPWKFADRVMETYLANPELITASQSFPLADVYAIPSSSLSSPSLTRR